MPFMETTGKELMEVSGTIITIKQECHTKQMVFIGATKWLLVMERLSFSKSFMVPVMKAVNLIGAIKKMLH